MNRCKKFLALAFWIFWVSAADAAGYSAWVPEWKYTQAMQEFRVQKQGLESVQIFAAYFDKNDAPFLTESITRRIEDAEAFAAQFTKEPFGARIPVYLSVVNDIYDPNGSDFKNPALVSRLVRSGEARAKHMADLLALLSAGPFDGLEIDYERVDEKDWSSFLEFCGELFAELDKRGKALRVVLEPQKKYYALPFPEGPEYVIMAYNLFGNHSGPGPKANPEFIRKIASWTTEMKVKPRLALATGGYIWENGVNGRQLTESEARLLCQREGVEPVRDPDSGCLFFQYSVGSAKTNTVWFADGETLAFLAAGARQSGFTGFALWVFAGNRRYSLEQWRNEVTK